MHISITVFHMHMTNGNKNLDVFYSVYIIELQDIL